MKTTLKYFTSTTIAVLLWSASFIATKIAYQTFEPLMVGFVRFFFATLILLVVRIFTKDMARPEKKDIKIMAISGLLGITIYFAAENIGVKLTTASNASLIVASYPAVTALLEFLVYRIKPRVKTIIGIIFAFIGIGVLTISQSSEKNDYALWGNIILIVAGIVLAFYNFYSRKTADKYTPVTVSYYQILFGTIFFLPLAFLEHGEIGTVSMPSIIALVYLSLDCSVGAFLLYNFGLRKLSASTSISLMNLVPVFGIIFSATLLNENISLRQIIGGVIVIIGVILSTTTKQKRRIKMEITNFTKNCLEERPDRCVMIMNKDLDAGHLANAIAVIALTIGQRHPYFVGAPLIDASGFSHHGLILIGIPMLQANSNDLKELRKKALEKDFDVVDFPKEGQQTKNYEEFIEMMKSIKTDDIDYLGIAIIGKKNAVNRLTKHCEMIK